MPTRKTGRSLATALEELGACDEAINWAKGRRISRAACHACDRGDWLAWLANELGIDLRETRKRFVFAWCDGADEAWCSLCWQQAAGDAAGAATVRAAIPYEAFEAALEKWEAAHA